MVLRAGGDKDRRLRPWHHMSCSFASGVVVQLTLSPLWVVKNNQQLGTYTSFFTGARKLWRSEGLRGFYRGITPGVLSAAQGGIQFLVYEEMRRLALAVQVKGQGAGSRDKQRARHGLGLLPVPVTMGITVLSKTAALLATSPLEVIKIRMRHVKSGEGYATVAEAASTIWNKEGVFGFYKGLGTNLIRLMPSQYVSAALLLAMFASARAAPNLTQTLPLLPNYRCITFVVYESVKEALLLRQESDTADTAAPP